MIQVLKQPKVSIKKEKIHHFFFFPKILPILSIDCQKMWFVQTISMLLIAVVLSLVAQICQLNTISVNT